MTAPAPEGTGQDPTDSEVAQALGIAEAGTDPAGEPEAGSEEQDLDALPQWARDLIVAARNREAQQRNEAAARRVRERDQSRRPAATATTDTPDPDALREEGRRQAREEYGVRLAQASITTALTGVVPDDQVADVVGDLNMALYVTDDGEPDADAIKALRERYVRLAGTRRTPKVSHGRTGTTEGSKSTAEQFADALGALDL